MVHPAPLYRIEGEPHRHAEGIYDAMNTVGAHEVLVQSIRHDIELWQSSDAEISQFLLLTAQRIQDLKGDLRFKYVTMFKNHGASAGQEFDHPVSELTAPRLFPGACSTNCGPLATITWKRSAASSVTPWDRSSAIPCGLWKRSVTMFRCARSHRACRMRSGSCRASTNLLSSAPLPSKSAPLNELAGLIRRTLQRVMSVSESFHLVLHTVPNTYQKSNILQYWKTVDEDYHWHIEILPIMGTRAKPYFLKEVYYTHISSEAAAEKYRKLSIR